MDDNIDNEDSGAYMGMLKLFVVLFADDGMIFAYSRKAFEDNLDCLWKYCEEVKMRINPSKSKIMIINTTAKDTGDILYHGQKLEIVTEFNYLCSHNK